MRIGIAAMDSALGYRGGVDIYTLGLVEALADNDPDNLFFILINREKSNYWSHRDWPKNVQFVALSDFKTSQDFIRKVAKESQILNLPIRLLFGEPWIKQQIERLDLDLIHYPSTIIYPIGVSASCVLTFFDLQHEYYPQFFSLSERLRRARYYRSSVRKAKHIIVPSGFTMRTLTDRFGTSSIKMSHIPVGVAPSFKRFSESNIEQIRKKYALPNQFIYYPANLWPHKNHYRLIKALSICRDICGAAPTLVLSGKLRDEFRDIDSFVTKENLNGSVMNLGYIPLKDLPGLYSAATIMVYASFFEGFGIPLIEAMACGCPIAASNVTSIPEVVGDAALLFDPYDPASIAESICQLFQNTKLQIRFRESGYLKGRDYKWSCIVPKLIQVYKATANQ